MHIDRAPLNQRSWVCQERFLSPFVLHFARRYLFYECPEEITSETHPDGLPGQIQSWVAFENVHSLKRAIVELKHSSPASHPPLRRLSNLYWHWCHFRILFTSLQLTQESDIFVALHGIAQEIGDRMQGELVAGMWKRRTIEGLCWTVRRTRKGPARPAKWRAPSWSWAATLQTIYGNYSGHGSGVHHDMREMLDVRIETDAVGDMVRGVLTLKCRLIALESWDDLTATESASYKRPGYFSGMFKTRFDELDTACSEYSAYLVSLRQHHSRNAEDYGKVEGLIITPSNDQPDCYVRIGYFFAQDVSLRKTFNAQTGCVIEIT